MRLDKKYIPCLRWKQGEYLAIEKMRASTKAAIIPLIEVPEIGFDFEKNKEVRSLDDHLKLFVKRVNDKWGNSECFVDVHIIDTSKPLVSGQQPIDYIFENFHLSGVRAIPVIRIKQDFSQLSLLSKIEMKGQRGVCIRISLEEASDPKLRSIVDDILKRINVSSSTADLILDIGSPNFEPLDRFVDLLERIIKKLPYLDNWRSFGLIGTSFPSSLSGIKSGITFLPRQEWQLYKMLVQKFRMIDLRIPTFGDYIINNPEILNLDPRVTKPKANVRYALSDSWLIVRGENVRDYGFEQHRDLCKLIINYREYYGDSFSPGDKYIYDCAKGKVSTGNLSTWRQMGTSHHLEVVINDVANLLSS